MISTFDSGTVRSTRFLVLVPMPMTVAVLFANLDSVTVCTLLNPSLYPSLFGVLSGEGAIFGKVSALLFLRCFLLRLVPLWVRCL